MLHDPEDPAEVRTRLALTAEYVRGRGALVFELEERKGTRITRTAALAQFGDYLSLYLALLGGADPTPIASIDWFKSRLAQSRKS